MGQVNLTNLTGFEVILQGFAINGEQIAASGTVVEREGTYKGHYDAKLWNDYKGMHLDIDLNERSYHVNLNRDHYFGGGDFHYPGDGSDVNYVLMGLSKSGNKVYMMQVYCQEGADHFLFDADSKALDAHTALT